MNNFIFWRETNKNCWEYVTKNDTNGFLYNLMLNENIDNSKIFIVPSGSILAGIWLDTQSHKSNRVDFFHFLEDYNENYVKPTIPESFEKVEQELKEKHGDDTKYGFVSPDGRYFHCNYQGHTSLADNICFGMIETNNAEQYLEEHGWIKIYKSMFSDTYAVYTGCNHIITKEQFETLSNMGLENAEGISEMLVNEERDY